MARTLAWLSTVLLISGCASELLLDKDGALAVIPHRTSNSGHFIVQARINGEGPFDFALDTGASISVLFEPALSKVSVETDAKTRVRVHGMTGSGTFPITNVARIQVDSEVWDNARLALIPGDSPISRRIDGILGVDFMRRYAFSYTQADKAVRLYPRELISERSYRGWHTIRLSELRVGDGDVSLWVFDMFIGGERIPAMFDLGTSVNLMNLRAARSFGIRAGKSRKNTDVSGAFGATIVATELFVWQPIIDDLRWQRTSFLVADFPVFEVLGLDKRNAAIAGFDLLKGRDFVIDFAGQRLLVSSRK